MRDGDVVRVPDGVIDGDEEALFVAVMLEEEIEVVSKALIFRTIF